MDSGSTQVEVEARPRPPAFQHSSAFIIIRMKFDDYHKDDEADEDDEMMMRERSPLSLGRLCCSDAFEINNPIQPL